MSWQKKTKLKLVHFTTVCTVCSEMLAWVKEMQGGENIFFVTEAADLWVQKC